MPGQGPTGHAGDIPRAPGRRECWSTWSSGGSRDPWPRARPSTAPGQSGGVLVDPVHGTGGKGAQGATAHRRSPPPRPRIPLWERGPRGRPPAAPTRRGSQRPPTTPSFPVPARGPRPRRGGRGAGVAATPRRADTPGGAPPLRRSRRPGPPHAHPTRAGRAQPPPAGRGRRARPADRTPPPPNPGRGAGWGTRPRGQRGPGSGPAERKEKEQPTPAAAGAPGRPTNPCVEG